MLHSTKKKNTHLDYYWIYHHPVDGTVLCDYQKGRGQSAPKKIFKGFKDYLQSGGYDTYEYYAKQPGATKLGSWAHARRLFYGALENEQI